MESNGIRNNGYMHAKKRNQKDLNYVRNHKI